MQKNQMSKKFNNRHVSKRGRIGEGKPRKYSDVEVFQKKIDEYFQMCEEKDLDPTVVGIALAVGLQGRKVLLDYEERPEYSEVIKRAKAKVEDIYVRRALGGKVNPAGAVFLLKNPPFGYRDVQEIEHSGPGGEPLELGNLELAARVLSILALGRQRREAEQLPEKVENSENPTPAKSHE